MHSNTKLATWLLLKVTKRPWRELNNLQQKALASIALGIVITVEIMILTRFHPIDPNRRAGLLGGSGGFIVVGVVLFFIGKNRRERKQK